MIEINGALVTGHGQRNEKTIAVKNPNELLRDAEAHFVANRLSAAQDTILSIEGQIGHHPAVDHLHGLILSARGELEKARTVLEGRIRLVLVTPRSRTA